MRIRVFAWSIASLLPLAAPAFASWSTDPSVNSPVVTPSLTRRLPVMIPDGANGTFVVCTESSDIRAQHLDAHGEPLWGDAGVTVCNAAGTQDSCVAASDRAGGLVIAWRDQRGGNPDIYAQRLDPSGATLWTANGVAVCTDASTQGDIAISDDDSLGAVIVWRDMRNNATNGADVYGQRVNAAGLPIWTVNGEPMSASPGVQRRPRVVNTGPNGCYYVVWEDNRGGPGYDLYYSRVVKSGGFYATSAGQLLAGAANDQANFVMADDGAGGVFVVWEDDRTGTRDIYASRFSLSGVALWGLGGVLVCGAAGVQQQPVLLPDAVGGLFVAWSDQRAGAGLDDVYAQRLSPAGVPQWTANGVIVSAAANTQTNPAMVTDGAGGIVVAFLDSRATPVSHDLLAQRLSGAGVAQWTADGIGLMLNPADTAAPFAAAGDGRGGIVVAASEVHGFVSDLFAQRADRYGFLGESEARIRRVRDVPNDQGGRVKLEWDASYLEFDGFSVVTSYDVFRSAPSSLLAARAGRTRSQDVAVVERDPRGTLYQTTVAGADYAWELLATVSALDVSSYSYIAATLGDSVAGSNPTTAFMVQARGASGRYWNSEADSGYSVDNLAPLAPAPFTGQYAGGATHLHWDRNHEADLAHYQLYRGASAGFTPGPANRIASPPDTGYADAGAAGSFYKLSAVDAHGNESGFALLQPSGTTGVGDGAPQAFALEGVSPNPSPGGRLRVAFALPSDAPARLELLDVSGRRVAARELASVGAGRHAVELAGERALAPGLYFVRLTQGANTRVTRVSVID